MSDMNAPFVAPPVSGGWLSARLCPLGNQRFVALTRKVERRDPSLSGVGSLVLRHSLIFSLLRPPLAAALRDFRCSRGASVAVRAAPLRDREGPAFSLALRLLSSCFPEGSVHRFVEHGLTTCEDNLFRLLTEATVAEREVLYGEALSRTAYDLRPSLAEMFERG